METTAKTIKDVGANFIPVKDITDNLDEVSVGHAGIYPVDIDDTEDVSVETIEPIILLTVEGGTRQIMLSVEDGLKTFVQDGLASKDQATLEKYGLSKDMERVKAIPDKITGAIVYYLTRGIEQDFGITWDKTPKSLKSKLEGNKSKAVKAREEGRRILSKKEKNELLSQRNYPYWEKDINEGKITLEEAIIRMKEASDKVKEYEDAGYYLSPNKTQGVSLYDWKSEVKEKLDGDDSVLKIYSRHSIILLVPCLENKIRSNQVINKKAKKEIDKSIVAGIAFDNEDSFMNDVIDGWNDLKKHYEPRTFHIAKINQSGKMKDRWFVVDAIKKSNGKQVLLMWDQKGVDGILE